MLTTVPQSVCATLGFMKAKVRCPVCQGWFSLCNDGTIHVHLDPDSIYYPRKYCAGSREQPATT